MSRNVSAAVKGMPSAGSPGWTHSGRLLLRMPCAMSRPPKENASDTRKIHIPIFPGVATPYWASGGHETGTCADACACVAPLARKS